jgi:hypothetical protein
MDLPILGEANLDVMISSFITVGHSILIDGRVYCSKHSTILDCVGDNDLRGKIYAQVESVLHFS